MTSFALTLPADLTRAAELAALMEQAIAAWGLDAKRAHALHLCAEEIFANIAMHGGGGEALVELTGDATAQRLVFTDDGAAFDPTAARPPPPAMDIAIGGRGLMLVRGFSDGMAYTRAEGRNRLELRFGPDKCAPR